MANDYDAIIVGGGLAGATLAKELAAQGARVLVLERERTFRDRVRGELVQPWGVAETRLLGIYDLLKQSCANEIRLRLTQIYGAPPAEPRDLAETTPQRAGSLHFPHQEMQEMQEVLLSACAQAGASVLRGMHVINVSPGPIPAVTAEGAEAEQTYRARLVIGADGRSSVCRKWGRFTVRSDPEGMVMAGVVFERLSAPGEITQIFINPTHGEVAFVIPLGGGRFRCYTGFYATEEKKRLGGQAAVPEFVLRCVSAGAPAQWFSTAEAVGPLASFSCAEMWVPHPYRDNFVLVGDAAATSNPVFGCGLSLSLRDVRVLSGFLSSELDWHAAAHAYAEDHDRYSSRLRHLLHWMTQLFYEPGAEAGARRQRAFRRIAEDPSRVPDIPGMGPEGPDDEATYYNLFGEPERA